MSNDTQEISPVPYEITVQCDGEIYKAELRYGRAGEYYVVPSLSDSELDKSYISRLQYDSDYPVLVCLPARV